jgi:CheY-like chemotaxis protein
LELQPLGRIAVTETKARARLGETLKVLVAEDNKEMRRLLVWALQKRGFQVTEACDGPDLFFRLSTQAGPEARYDLLVSDIRMPHMTGLEVMQGLQRVERLLPPTILITAFGDDQIHRRAEELGAAIVDKPFELDDLMEKIEETLSLRSTSSNEKHSGRNPGGHLQS